MIKMGYPKLNTLDKCAHPDRKECNYGDGYDRCEYMKYNNSKSIFDSTRWECIYKTGVN